MHFILCIENKRRYEVGGVITLILNKEGGSLAIYMVRTGGGPYRNFDLSNIFFPPPSTYKIMTGP